MRMLNHVKLGLIALALSVSIVMGKTCGAEPDASASREPVKPEMLFSDSSRLGRPFAKDPAVVCFGGRYLMYFSLPGDPVPTSGRGWSAGVAESRDLIHWTKIGEVTPQQECEKNGLAAPEAIVLDGRVHLFYQTYGNGPKDAICHAVSDDGIHFQRNPTNPIFQPQGDWNVGRAIDAEVFPLGDQLLLYFATRDPEMKIQMQGVAAAELNSDYGRDAWKQIGDGPILEPELDWEQECIEAATLCQRGGWLYMFYAGAYNNKPQQIGCAVSQDGIAWTRLSDEPLLPCGEPNEWNASESGHPGVLIDEEGRGHLFFQGNNDNGRTWFISKMHLRFDGRLPYLVRPRDGREFRLHKPNWPE